MRLVFTIEVVPEGVKCSGEVDGESPFDTQQANLIAVGALEIARTSLLAQRWGLILNKPKEQTE